MLNFELFEDHIIVSYTKVVNRKNKISWYNNLKIFLTSGHYPAFTLERNGKKNYLKKNNPDYGTDM